jgi:hypothetical protein
MSQYDAGPGDWSDRPWEDPDRKARPQARRRRVTLPPWALLVILVAIIILLCVGLVLIVRAIRGDGDATATPPPTATTQVLPTNTLPLVTSTASVTPTDTVVLPLGTASATPEFSEIAPGALVVVQDTLGAGLNLRAEPDTTARVITNAREGTVLTVLEGPQQAGQYTWWKLRTPGGEEGWGAADWLALKTD